MGMLTADHQEMHWWDDARKADGKLLAILKKPEIVHANSDGIKFRGYEPAGYERNGNPKFRYQEWWIVTKKL